MTKAPNIGWRSCSSEEFQLNTETLKQFYYLSSGILSQCQPQEMQEQDKMQEVALSREDRDRLNCPNQSTEDSKWDKLKTEDHKIK